jgi:DNA invertase Pin-like site-specific DNA recombinase
MSPKRIARPLDVYIRVSDVKGRSGESFISPKEQEDRCRSALAARGLEVGDVYTDLDVSGGTMERPEFAKIRKRIEDGVSGGIVVARIDRFGRTVARALDAIEEIDHAGGVVITAEGDFDTSTAVGELVLGMMLQLAQFELRRIRENWSAAKRRAVERGVHIAPRVPAGYRRNEQTKILEPDGKHAKTIRDAYTMAARGDSYARIATLLNNRGLPTWSGNGVWQPNRIKRLLENRVYLGEARSGNGHTNPDAHEPLVGEQTWTLAQRRSDSPAVTTKAETLLAGLCRCASCSFAMRSQSARGNTIATYRCSTTSVHGRCPAPTSISLERLETYVIDQFLERASVGLHQTDEPAEDEEESTPRSTQSTCTATRSRTSTSASASAPKTTTP